jgi:hypothetical protein
VSHDAFARCQILTDLSGLNHRRYAINDETLYVAPSDKRTDYSQPPMNNFYYGVLNTGRRRYAHPALSGSLPQPWLPSLDRPRAFGDGAKERRGVVLSLRRKKGKMLRRSQADLLDPPEEGEGEDGGEIPEGWSTGDILRDGSTRPSDAIGEPEDESEQNEGQGQGRMAGSNSNLSTSSSLNPWGEPTPTPMPSQSVGRARQQTSYDPSSGVIALPDEENVWDDSGSEGEEQVQESPVSHLLEWVRITLLTHRSHTSIIPRGGGPFQVERTQDPLYRLQVFQSRSCMHTVDYFNLCI